MTITIENQKQQTVITLQTTIKGQAYQSQSKSRVGYQQAIARAAQNWRQSLKAAGEYYNSWNSPIGWNE
jgi:hypothetical protein